MFPRGHTRPPPAQLAPFLAGTGTDPVDLKAMVVGSQVNIDLRQSMVQSRGVITVALTLHYSLSFTQEYSHKNGLLCMSLISC